MSPGNVHDSHILQPLVERILGKVKKPLAVAADAAYKTPAITNFLFENEMLPVLPYTRPKTKDGFFRKHDYVYDEYYDCYLCQQGQVLQYTTTTKEGIGNINRIRRFVQNVRLYHRVQKVKIIKVNSSSYLGSLPRRGRTSTSNERNKTNIR